MNLNGIWQSKKISILCRIAWRNLARHKIKTVLTASAIMVSVAMFIFINGWLNGMIIDSRRNIVNYEMGAAKLQTKLYFEKKDEMPSYENFTDWEKYRSALDAEGYASAPRYVFSGTLFSSSGSAPIVFYGVEPELEAQTMRYVPYVDFGRFPQNGNFEIALGTVAAEKLKVGIPARPFRAELENLISSIASNQEDEDFIRSLYNAAGGKRAFWDVRAKETTEGNERMILKKDASPADLDRYWNMLDESGRNDVRINAVIDIKAVPEIIRNGKWEGELMPSLRAEDISLVEAAYEYQDFMGGYLLAEKDEMALNNVLSAMIRAGFSGAVCHINQSVDVKVSGVINSPAPLPNGNTAFIPLDILQDEVGMMLEGAVTELVIREKNAPGSRLPGKSESAEEITSALKRGLAGAGVSILPELAVHTWDEYMQDYLGYEAIENTMPQMIAALLLLLSFLGISNTILLAILERTKETGMMRAMGMTDRQMIIVYMLEAGFLGFIGSVFGIILGCIINYPMVEYGIDFSAMTDVMGGEGIGFRVTSLFRSMWNIPVIIGSGVSATIIASCMAFFPTRRALKMPITESLRFE
ncbi:MAG: FtsX-like permease family protein [Treponema sp.]|jgi:ABC-type lipoprotein release transport system permease subunit|nr:FtsX-like permease family protein [Treponema sp.]